MNWERIEARYLSDHHVGREMKWGATTARITTVRDDRVLGAINIGLLLRGRHSFTLVSPIAFVELREEGQP